MSDISKSPPARPSAVASYDEAMRRLLLHEGGYSNHPSDPGGPTNFGITIIDYRKYIKPDATAADVQAMRIEDAKAIYRARYWDALRCDELPAGLDYAVFDYGVNSGIARAAKVLQRVAGVDDDGRIGPKTLAAVRARDSRMLITAICEERLAFLQRLKTWPVFGKGWGRRVAEVKAAALAMNGRPKTSRGRQMVEEPPHPSSVAGASSAAGKGVVPIGTAAQTSAAGVVAAAGGTVAAQRNDAASVAAIVLATAAIAAGIWLFWRWRQRRRQLASR